MPISNFSGSAISDTYPRIVQTDGYNLADGTGSFLDLINVTASYALNSSVFPYTGSAEITGSLTVTGSVSATLLEGVINGGTF